MSRILIFILIIILIFPVLVTAHEGEDHAVESVVGDLGVEAGILPGELFYFLDQIGEWAEVNLLTPSTKQKHFARVGFAEERIAELYQLVELDVAKRSAFQKAGERYRQELNRAEDMAEKILILDGAELALAEKFEYDTRLQEQLLRDLLGLARPELKGVIMQAISSARIENQKMFNYMVKNYQFTESDIEKHRAIVREHIEYVQAELMRGGLDFPPERKEKIGVYFEEAEKFLAAGLNVEAYQYVNRVKNIFYSAISN